MPGNDQNWPILDLVWAGIPCQLPNLDATKACVEDADTKCNEDGEVNVEASYLENKRKVLSAT